MKQDKQKDFIKLIYTELSVSPKRQKTKICLTLDHENFDFYNRIAKNSNRTLQRVLNLALLCFQKYIQEL